MHACIFCGAHAPANYKNVPHSFVASDLQVQHSAGINEPILDLMRNMLAVEVQKPESVMSEREEGDVKDIEDDSNITLHSCMC